MPWTSGAPRTSSPVLVGRSRPLGALRSAVRTRPAVAMVEGEAGVGKSRLVRELIDGDLGPLAVLIGHCHPVGEPFPFGAVLDALREVGPRLARLPRLNPVTGVVGPLLPEIAEHLPPPPPSTGDPRADRHRLFRGLRELLNALGPALLVVEDLHWADDGSRRLLRFLMGDPPPDLAVVVTYRRAEVPGGLPLGTAYRPPSPVTGVVVGLEPLDAAGVRALTSAILGEDTSAEFAARLHERTAGLPFVVEEVLRTLRDQPGDARLLDAVGVPVLLRDAMAERLAALPATATRLAEAAAVLGVPAPAELLGEVAAVGAQRVDQALTSALSGQVLHEAENGRYGFRHALARQAVYDTLTGPGRRQLHARAIDALEQVEPRPLVQLAEHSARAGRVAGFLRYGEAAADRAAEQGDATAATGLLRRLLDQPNLPAADVDRLAIKLGRVAHTGLDQHDPAEALARLLTDPRLSTSVRGEVRLYRGLLLVRQSGAVEQAMAEIETAVADLAERPDLAAKGFAVLGQPFVGITSVTDLARWRTAADAFRASTDDVELRMSLLANELSSRLHIGDPTALAEIAALPTAITGTGARRQLARAHCNVGDAMTSVGHFRLAAGHLRCGLRLATEAGGPFVVGTARTTTARLDWFTGQWTGLAERAGALLEEYRDLVPIAGELSLVLGLLAATRGEWAEATGHLGATGAFTPEESIAPVAIAGCAGLAGVALAQEDACRAVVEAERGLDIVRRKGVWAWAGELGPVAVSAYLAAGRHADAEGVVAEFAAGLSGRDVPIAAAALVECRGLVDGSSAALREAADLYAALPAPYLAALATERAEPSVAELAALVDAFDALGATRDAARCRHRLRTLGGGTPSRRGRRGYGNELSPRELEVARLLASGHTNREIADVLFLSPRTVEQHAARVLRKLGAVSRTDLDAEALP
ncbi:ATP-binding protein [Actinokineospora spheciospongiae]|uniref:ATP-binding protein n=1 Tax=Actinokineospora spheciospongiae TaxID=909613 RepID=UPI00055841B9|nr:LuxR family transcriptional regulator [Actinokineospora spheciospongiae]